jgi:phosphoribosylcarboxyaminoimidazole (NCAIR) mutase
LLTVAIMANSRSDLREKLRHYRHQLEQKIRETELS